MKFIIINLFILGLAQVSNAQVVTDGSYIAVHTGYGSVASELKGDGFTAELPYKGSFIYGAEVSYQFKESTKQVSFKYDKVRVEQDAPDGLSPSTITIDREEVRFLFSFSPWDTAELEHLKFGIGYGFLTSGATDTSPNNVMTKQTTQGLLLHAKHKLPIEGGWSINPEVLLYFPHQINETDQVTGYNPKYYGIELKIGGEYQVSERVKLFGALMHRTDTVSYSGSVSRDVRNGKDTRNYFSVPLGIKVDF